MREEGLPSNDDYKIEPVPCISQIGVAMEDEAHCNDLHDELESEDAREEEATVENEVIIGRWGIVMIGLVIIEHEDDSVAENEEENGIVEPAPGDEPDETSSEFAVIPNAA